MKNCMFCQIVKGEIDSTCFWEDDDHMAIFDIYPNTKGMALVISKKHYDSSAFDMPDEAYSKLMLASKKMAKILEKGLLVKRVGMILEGMGQNHVHNKIYPMHGLKSSYEDLFASEKIYFEKYEGYLTSLLGPKKADITELKKLAEQLKQS